jgi:hypothetical protein
LWVLGAIAVIAGIAGYAMWVLSQDVTGGNPSAACVLVIDRTVSAGSEDVVENYHDLADRAVDGCQEEDAELSIYYFDQASANLVQVGDAAYKLFPPQSRSRTKQKVAVDKVVDEAHGDLDAVFDSTAAAEHRSDVLAAVSQAASALNATADDEGLSDRYLVVLTDGIQLSPDVSVEAFDGPSAPVDPLVESAAEVGEIPELEGVSVTMLGVRSGVADSGDPLFAYFEEKVEQFWRGVVTQGGGEMCQYAQTSEVVPGADCD